MVRTKPTNGIIKRLTFNLVLTVGLLLGTLIARVAAGSFILSSQQGLDDQKLQISQDIEGILRSMIDQETGVRGYLATNDQIFLEPYTTGRTQYLTSTQDLENRSRQADPELSQTLTALRLVEDRADDWFRNSAEIEITQMKRGGTAMETARSTQTALSSKARFDTFRQATDGLRQKATGELADLQNRTNQFNLFALGITLVLAAIAVLLIWIAFNRFIGTLRRQMDGLMEATTRFGEGDLTARIVDPMDDELGRLGTNFNAMALALETQQRSLKQRDIQDNLLSLNNTLSQSLELELLLDGFVAQLLNQLHVEVGAVYLYNPQTNFLSVAAVQGFERSQLQPLFTLGEDLLGRAAATRQPMIFNQPDDNEVGGFKVKTILGQVLPATLLYLPLTRGVELLGVLCIGTFQPMSENTRNVLSVVSGNLAAAISNAMAFRHIQSQADELERRQHELERSNGELSQQRDELTVLNTALEEANRLRSQFLSTMSHELRTPLTAIIGFSQLILRSNEVSNFSPKQKLNIERILKNGQHLLGLVNDVLDIAKIEAGRMDVSRSEIALAPFVASIIDQTQSLATQKGLALHYEVAPDTGNVETDAEKLRQILLNLVSNAIKFTEKGSVNIRVSNLAAVSAGKHGQTHDQIVFEVRDTGIGIEPAQQKRIFEEFYQADSTSTRKYGGTGLGLSIVQKLTDLLGGTIELESQPGEGTIFRVILPRRGRSLSSPADQTDWLLASTYYPSRLSQPTPTPLEGRPVINDEAIIAPAKDKRVVLAVDDDPDIVELIHASLENSLYEVVGLSDPTQVLAKVVELRPYAVTLDVMMPGANGWQVLQQLKSNPHTATTPVIMLTIISDRSAGYVLGANDYLVKPIDRDVLLKTLDRFMTRQEQSLLVSAVDSSTYSRWRASGETANRPEYVLVIDDEADIRSVLEQTLAEAGFEVKTAAGGLEGLRLVEQAQPSVILLDLMMPDLDGFEVLNRLKASPTTATIPVIILTAKTLTSEDYERLRWGASRIIQKGSQPLNLLLEELTSILQRFQPPGRL